MMANMACSLIEHKRITTTVATRLRGYVEPLVNRSKEDSTQAVACASATCGTSTP